MQIELNGLTLASNLSFVARPDWPHGMAPATFETFLDGCRHHPQVTLKRFVSLCSQGAEEPRTLARLFRDELGTSFARWRQQVVLAHAMPMLARGVSVARVAQASGYASESAFSAMFKSAMGLPPTRLLAQARARPQATTASSTRG